MRSLEIAPGRHAHWSGALWLEASRTALIADLHLGYGWAQRRRGELGPVQDSRTEPLLEALLEELRPQRIVVLGDLVHAPKPGTVERETIERAIGAIRKSSELILVRGNHDRAFARDFVDLEIPIVDEWASEGLLARHGDRLTDVVPENIHLVLGHLHPVFNLRDSAGAKHRFRLFLTNERVTVLPAFAPFSAGYEVNDGLPADVRRLFGSKTIKGLAISGKRVREAVVFRGLPG